MTHAKKTACIQSTAAAKTRMVLIVDSDELHRTYHTMVLERFEYCVRAAATAAEALQMIDDAVPALVITELDLPGMSGLDLLARIQQEPRTAGIPVVALAANRDHATEIRCLRAGFTAFLGTPVGVEELYRTIQTAIEPVRRSSPRVHAKIPIFVNNVPLDSFKGECASVISEHGMYIRTLNPHPRYSRVDVRILLEGRTIAAGAVVLYSHGSGEGPFGDPGMGIKFAEIAPPDQEILRRYIKNELAPL